MTPIYLHITEDFYAEYLKAIFPARKDKDIILVTLNHPLGHYIRSCISQAPAPKKSWGNNQIRIYLPYHNATAQNFIYFNKYNTEMINKQIATNFDNDFTQFCLLAQQAGISIKSSIQMFIRTLKLTSTKGDLYDRLKKKDYRRRKKIENLFSEALKLNFSLLQDADYQHKIQIQKK